MLVATSEIRIGDTGMRSTVMLERAVRGHAILRDGLAFDTRFAAPAPGMPESVGHVFMLLAGRLVPDRGPTLAAPLCYVLGDDEVERVTAASRTYRTDGDRVHVIQLRLEPRHVRSPIGFAAGPIALSDACWADAGAVIDGARDGDAAALGRLLGALGSVGVIDPAVVETLCADEPERFRRLWDAVQPLFATHGAATSLKQIAGSLDLSERQVSRDMAELALTFGLGGYRDALLVVRLRAAALLLSSPGAPITEVARLAGYGSPIAMARAFRDAGLPAPSVIRAALQK